MNQEDQIWFDKALANTLSAEEQNSFDKRLEDNPSFKEDFELFKSMNTYLDSKAENKDALEALNQVKKEQRDGKVPSINSPNKALRILMIMLMLSLIFLLGLKIFKKANVDELQFAEYYVEPLWPVERGNDRDSLQAAIAKYLIGQELEAKNAIKLLDTPLSSYWLAEIYFKEQKGDSLLMHLPADEYIQQHSTRINYLHIITLIQTGKVEQAYDLFNEVEMQLSETYRKKLIKIFGEIKK